ncbi:hypothetical protein PVAND_002096 [Polypedilum vanderplanki]|uniref:Uncharacterized protein n=1 Tax=Polypedilum vanderplanki TaxID=319348 RepID=A0A9J6BQD2_POLVA|nr:hypothetical protein PVAND_002096 [Polypedilum vanderplanki]
MEEKNNETGFQAIINKRNSCLTRFFWLIALSASIGGLLFHLVVLYRKYGYEPDLGVKISQKPMRDIPFPAITICSPVFAKNNIVNYRKFGMFFEMTGKNLTTEQKNYFAANYQVCNPSDEIGDYEIVSHFLKKRTDFDLIKLVEETSLNVTDLMLVCAVHGVPIDCTKIFTRVLTDFGLCFTFNMQANEIIYNSIASDSFKARTPETWNKSNKTNKRAVWTLDKSFPKDFKDDQIPYRAVKKNRLSILLNLKQENAENFCPTMGKVFTTILHLPNEVPTIFHDQYFTQYNYGRRFLLSAISYKANNDIRKYSPKARGCYFDDERKLKFFKTYTRTHCNFECLSNYSLKICGCVKFSMPHDKDTPICDLAVKQCYVDALNQWPEKIDGNKVVCNCLPTCNHVSYKLKNSKEILIDYVDDFLGSALRPVNSTDAMLSFRFIEPIATEHQKFIAYRFENFMADIGGLLGLFMGCSLITFVEIFYTIARLFFDKQKKKNAVEKIEINADENEMYKSKQVHQILKDFQLNQREVIKRILKIEENVEQTKREIKFLKSMHTFER